MLNKKKIIKKRFLGGIFDSVGDVFGGVTDFIGDIAGPLLGAGGQIGGSVIAGNLAQRNFREQLQFQDTLSKEGIQRKVKDAQAAGIHPLYALGANTFSPSPIYSDTRGLGDALGRGGQQLGTALQRIIDPTYKETRRLQNELLQSQIELNESRAKAVRPVKPTVDPTIIDELTGAPRGTVDVPSGFKTGTGGADWEGIIEITPPKVKTGKKGVSGVMSGTYPGYQEFKLPGGLPIQLPSTEEGSLAEALEAIPWYSIPGILDMNAKFYKGNWYNDFADLALFGNVPDRYYMGASYPGPRRKQRGWSLGITDKMKLWTRMKGWLKQQTMPKKWKHKYPKGGRRVPIRPRLP